MVNIWHVLCTCLGAHTVQISARKRQGIVPALVAEMLAVQNIRTTQVAVVRPILGN